MMPWVSREMHDAVLAERERVIVQLRAQIAMLERRLLEPVHVTVTLPEDFAVIQPAFIRGVRHQGNNPRREKPAPINYAEVDPNNNAQIAEIIAKELGPGQHNRIMVARKVADIKRHIQIAQSQKRSRTVEPGTVGTLNQTIETPDPDEVEAEENGIPKEILQRIELAAQGNR